MNNGLVTWKRVPLRWRSGGSVLREERIHFEVKIDNNYETKL